MFLKGPYWDLCSFLYINDLTAVSKFLCQYFLLMIPIFFCTGTGLKDMIRQINEEMAKIYAWVNANKLSLSIDKTNFMMFMPKGFSYCADYIVINQTRIQEVKETKFLGVIIDNKLKWSAHISYISKKISESIGIILKPEKFSAMRPCYHCITHLYILIWVIAFMCGAWHIKLILMILLYCRTKGMAYKTHLTDLVVLQNKAMRIINGVPPRTNMDNFYIENNILTVKHIYNYSIGLFMYKYINKMTPDVFDNFSAVFLIYISMKQEMPQYNYSI